MDELDAVVDAILRSPQINKKIVVLCEGDLPETSSRQRLSPQRYAQYERLPDANFYKACVPRNWHNSRTPAFFNCGGRTQVLYVYQALLAEHEKDPTNSYLSPEKLYALVDLDIQSATLPNDYPWKTTEELHAELYQDAAVKPALDERHRIWVTALVHKEAFFILPCTAAHFAEGVLPYWNGVPFDVRAIHAALAQRFVNDGDAQRHFEIVQTRLARFALGSRLDCTDVACLANSWLGLANAAAGDEYESLARALLAIAKAKEVWKEIGPDPNDQITLSAEQFRDQLALKIAAAISMLEPSAHPLAGFFAWLKARR